MIDLTGRVAVVLAAGAGIGRATALTLSRLGATVAVLDHDDLSAAGTALMAEPGERMQDFPVDATRPETFDEARRGVEAELGVPDILVATFAADGRRRIPAAGTRPFLDGMIRRGRGGRVVTVSGGEDGDDAIGFTMDLARELVPYGILVNCVAAGPVDTPRAVQGPVRQKLTRRIPLKRLGSPDEIASAVAFLASDQASYITGQVLPVNGGLAMFR